MNKDRYFPNCWKIYFIPTQARLDLKTIVESFAVYLVTYRIIISSSFSVPPCFFDQFFERLCNACVTWSPIPAHLGWPGREPVGLSSLGFRPSACPWAPLDSTLERLQDSSEFGLQRVFGHLGPSLLILNLGIEKTISLIHMAPTRVGVEPTNIK